MDLTAASFEKRKKALFKSYLSKDKKGKKKIKTPKPAELKGCLI